MQTVTAEACELGDRVYLTQCSHQASGQCLHVRSQRLSASCHQLADAGKHLSMWMVRVDSLNPEQWASLFSLQQL
jgi:hypothetical protein